jgi:hypothetical protein
MTSLRFQPVALAACLLLAMLGCREGTRSMESASRPSRPIDAVLADHTPSLMANPGVVAVGRGELKDGTSCIRVFLEKPDPELQKRIPARLEGHPVEVVIAGPIRAMPDSGR